MYTDMYITPNDVSFAHLKFAEGSTTAVTSGWFDIPAADGGIFKGLTHASWQCNIATGNIDLGSKILCPAGHDMASFEDTGRASPPRPAFANGSMAWNIPWQYSADSGNTFITFDTRQQSTTINASGDATLSKGGVSVSNLINDPDHGF